jgi:hypothetical protein
MSFDNVHLTADPNFPAHVPDILALKLTLDIDGKYDTMKIDVYPDPCAAKLGAGLREATDLVGTECITNLADLAELVKTWTDDKALTEPKAKEQVQEGDAKPIYIVNAGFEDPEMNDGTYEYDMPGWEGFGDAWFGNSDPAASGGTYWGYGGITPEGENLGIVGGGNAEARLEPYMAQILTETLAANLTYELTVEVGNSPMYDWNGYKVQLLAGGTVIAEDDSYLTPADNTFETSLVTYTSGATPAQLGELLEIRLMALGFESADIYLEVNFDDVTLYYESVMKPSPADGAYVYPTDERELGWTNTDPNKPGDPLYVDVWFGTDPNKLPPPSPTYDFNKIVDAVEDANSVTVDANDLGAYYWQVNTYVYGSATGDPAEGAIWEFHVVTDAPVSADAGNDWVTWSGQEVQLAAASIDDDAVSALTIAWSADPNDGVVFTPNDGGDGSTSSAENPTVTITKVTDNPSVVTLTLSAQDAVSSDEDTMTIKVYDNSCLAAIGEGLEYDSGDFDVDCDTDIEDYAAMAEEWLVYKELATSVVKP